ncbi:MAG: glycoside hydrolase family 3 C-terminal domain-containing protein, partial [Novosphingobium sp.]|nr:glycoside hydrolase family 3 C-terminal domain-containing protein [Novosphingobium sp.]
EAGRMIGSEARAKGFNMMLAGGVNLVRDPRAGRNFEYLGEDPLLAGTLAAAQIDGIQSNAIAATIKHFALNDQETGRSSASVEMDEGAMRESDLLAFQIGIEGGRPGSVMCSYNRVYGKFACESAFLLNDVLRRDWGYKGFVMSDWGAVHSTESIVNGLDQQSAALLDGKQWLGSELVAAIDEGRVDKAVVDTAVSRILYAIYDNGLADHPVTAQTAIDYEANGKVAQATAEEGIVLLRNEGGILPLASTARRIAVIGGHADIGVLSGGGSSQVTPVGGARKIEKAAKGMAASFVRRIYGGAAPLDALRAEFPDAEITFADGSDLDTAKNAASAADIAVVFAERFNTETEDTTDLSLEGDQDALISSIAAANPKTVVVLETGNPVAMPWRSQVPAILAAWYPGQNGAAAIARILSGKTNPSGHLPVTFPASLEQLPNPILPGSNLPPPSKEDKMIYGINVNSPPFDITYPEGSDAGYRWFDAKGEIPLYAFGHGLSYTSFAYDRLEVKGGKTLTVSFRVTNTGGKAGADVPQVYVRRPGKAKRLIGWDKPMLAPGESATVTVTADRRVLADFDAKHRRWVVPAGNVTVEVGHSAIDPVLTGKARLSRSTMKP